jgi:hypothetical protein
VIFEGRSLPSQVYDELMGILVHGCMGELMGLRQSCTQVPDIDGIDIMTSKTSTLPYDDDKMQKMITLVQIAKGKLLRNNGIAVTDL